MIDISVSPTGLEIFLLCERPRSDKTSNPVYMEIESPLGDFQYLETIEREPPPRPAPSAVWMLIPTQASILSAIPGLSLPCPGRDRKLHEVGTPAISFRCRWCPWASVRSDAPLLKDISYLTGGQHVSHEIRLITATTPPTVCRESETRIIQGFWGVGRGCHLVLILGKETRNHRRQMPHPQASIHLKESFLNSKIQWFFDYPLGSWLLSPTRSSSGDISDRWERSLG